MSIAEKGEPPDFSGGFAFFGELLDALIIQAERWQNGVLPPRLNLTVRVAEEGFCHLKGTLGYPSRHGTGKLGRKGRLLP